MYKTPFSLLIMLALVLGSIGITNAQEEESPMWETIILTPDNTKLKILGENMRKHNQKYHNEGPYNAMVNNIVTGPNSGKMVWMMGPLKFAHLDSRPSTGGHDDDWRDNVMPYIKKATSGEYWTGDVKLSNTSSLTEDPADHPITFVRYLEVNEEHFHNFSAMLKKISETVKSMDGDNPWGIYYNQFRQGNDIGRHVASVSFYKNWAEFDEAPTFKQAYLKVHGDNSWDAFIRNMDQVLDNSWDEIWEYNKNLSGK